MAQPLSQHPRTRQRLLTLLLLPLLLLSLSTAWLVAPVGAASCTVTNTADSGTGSLRAAMDDTTCTAITITATGTITLSTDLPNITYAVRITGPTTGNLSIGGVTNTFSVTAGGNLVLRNVTITGGYVGVSLSGGGTATVTNSTITGNGSNGSGLVVDSGSKLTLGNSTVTGYAYGLFMPNGGKTSMINTTFAGNGTYNLYGMSSTFLLTNTLLVKDSGKSNCKLGLMTDTFTDGGHNLIDDASCKGITDGTNGNIVNPSGGAGLDPAGLADNGGPTKTFALLQTSPAVDKGDPAICASAPVKNVDQRSYNRPAGTACDIGAFEYGATAQTFGDVAQDYWAYSAIETLFARGITTGCSTNPTNYCPEQTFTRAEMAVFLSRATGHMTGTTPTGRFADVSTNHWAAPYIQQIVDLGITNGCGDGTNFCPNDPVTREQMAVFLLRAKGWSPATPASPSFVDVSSSHWAYGAIEQLKAQNVTQGLYSDAQGLHYAPGSSVTRAQMAMFIIRAWP